jgi:uncharacterized membrane protein YwzB
MTLIGILVFLIIIGVAFWAIGELSGALNIPAPIVTVLRVLLVVLVVAYMLQGLGVDFAPIRLR